MAVTWYISSTQNNGYPTNTGIIAYPSDKWISPYPYNKTNWHIDSLDVSSLSGGNAPTLSSPNPYPYIYTAVSNFADTGGGSGEGEGDIIDTGEYKPQKRSVRDGNIGTWGSDVKTPVFDHGITPVANSIAATLNCFSFTDSELKSCRDAIYDYASSLSGAAIDMWNTILGRNIFNGILICRKYPFDIGEYGTAKTITICGQPLTVDGTDFVGYTTNAIKKIDCGSVDLSITTAHQLRDCTYSLYLPYCGERELPMEGNELIEIAAYVDLLSGNGIYIVTGDDQLITTEQFTIGVDIPLNLTQAAQQRNMRSNFMNLIGRSLTSLASQSEAGALVSAVNDMIIPETGPTMIGTNIDGANAAAYCMTGKPRITIREKIVHKNARGYSGTIGENKQEYKEKLKNLVGTGKITCRGYWENCSTALAAEKAKIEQLMASGVII